MAGFISRFMGLAVRELSTLLGVEVLEAKVYIHNLPTTLLISGISALFVVLATWPCKIDPLCA